MYKCLDCGNTEKFIAREVQQNPYVIVDSHGEILEYLEDHEQPFLHEPHKCFKCDSMNVAEMCTYKEVFNCESDCSTADFLCGDIPDECPVKDVAYQCPECDKGIINPTIHFTMACDKCDFDENIHRFNRIEGYEEVYEFFVDADAAINNIKIVDMTGGK